MHFFIAYFLGENSTFGLETSHSLAASCLVLKVKRDQTFHLTPDIYGTQMDHVKYLVEIEIFVNFEVVNVRIKIDDKPAYVIIKPRSFALLYTLTLMDSVV